MLKLIRAFLEAGVSASGSLSPDTQGWLQGPVFSLLGSLDGDAEAEQVRPKVNPPR